MAEVIDLTTLNDADNQEDSRHENQYDARETIEPVITTIIDALGGVEQGKYRMGEQAGACLKDLKKLWRRDDTDDDRTVARIFWEKRLLQNDLVPILLATAGEGLGDDKRAISCVDLMTAMTWPIDMAEELKELDDEEDKNADFTQLVESHLYYKSSLVRPDIMKALFNIIISPLSKSIPERSERDCQIVTVVLYLIRNLAFVQDLRPGANLSANQLEFTSLQSRLIKELSASNFLEFILTISSNSEKDPWLTGWNTIALEILYLFYRGVSPVSLSTKQIDQPREKLQRLLNTESRLRREAYSNPSTRHSRFGTTISIIRNPKRKQNEGDPPPPQASVLHRQQALNKEAVDILDIKKRQNVRKGNTVDALSREDNLSVDARVKLQELANEFLKACFNSFVATLLKDIRLERARITEKDKLRLLFVTKFFLDYFLALRAQEQQSQMDKDTSNVDEKWPFGLIAEVMERDWIVWVLKRMREAVDEKPKLWNELQAGIECLTQLLLLIDTMSRSTITDSTLAEAADLLQQQIIYNGDILDIAMDSLRAYRPGSQSLAYLDTSIHLAYVLMRILERWSKGKGDGVYVRRKTVKRQRKAKGVTEEEGIPDAEDEEVIEKEEDIIQETLFTFDAFEMKFANADINQTLLIYLTRYKEFESPDQMRRVVSLLHRQAVKAKAEGLFFNVSTLDLFKTIVAEKTSLPRDQPYKDLISLINFILRKFFKSLAEDAFLAVFFPKNRGHWKQYSSWEADEHSMKKKKKGRAGVVEEEELETRFPPDVHVKKGYSWSDQLGIVIAALVEADLTGLVNWTKEILASVGEWRRKIIIEGDIDEEDDQMREDEDDDDDGDGDKSLRKDRPSVKKTITDYEIPYLNDEHAKAATRNSELKLLFRLCKFDVRNEEGDELQWYVPAAVLPADLEATLNVINQFMEKPIDLEGKKASSLLNKKRRRRRRQRNESGEEEEEVQSKRKEKKKKEKEQYKSAQFIQDSDEEYGDMDTFLEKEKMVREKAELAGAAAVSGQSVRPIGMRAHGRKQKKKKEKADDERRRLSTSLTSDESDEDEDRRSALPRQSSSPGEADKEKGRRITVIISDEEE
ncbi:hypothetical protein AGABI2DRAFT_75426 [Agaricus bisporus var. bisporus H97]|uniref:hypothetical protein n=1 Tax=Agaricus bisporus var. bisporus (strain H97 / ATCC MYA-4626 / FGSC 10389) TaxID=936046 RepID=UPI00029F5435|nr:hypothetical protein AGABI2DRAFT_75426 [Agaricus bisporus var. bisporus H97]EKV43857.1 hypothetical protein AGABI2DRAFT_75426 [Agaricus bisporus var. bisporus H97]